MTNQLCTEREKTHGDFAARAVLSQELQLRLCMQNNWPNLTSGQREALQMICVKISRILHGDPNCADHWQDIAGYAELGGKNANR